MRKLHDDLMERRFKENTLNNDLDLNVTLRFRIDARR